MHIKKGFHLLVQNVTTIGILKQYSLFLGHVLQQKKVGKGRLENGTCAWRPCSGDVLFSAPQQARLDWRWLRITFLCQSQDDKPRWTLAKFCPPTEKLLVFGYWGSSKTLSSQVGPILLEGQVQLPLSRLQWALWTHWHVRAQLGPHWPALHSLRDKIKIKAIQICFSVTQ